MEDRSKADSISYEFREPTLEEIDEMQFWIETGCVHESYLEEVIGDISKSVGVLPSTYYN